MLAHASPSLASSRSSSRWAEAGRSRLLRPHARSSETSRGDRRSAALRAGFTLIELIVVVAIIAILAALVLPAVMGANNAAEAAQSIADLKMVEKAIVDYRSQHGYDPPSGISLHEDPRDWFDDTVGTTPTGNELSRRDNAVRVLNTHFPGIELTGPTSWSSFYDTTLGGTTGGMDLNRNGATGDEIFLNGAECLVLFLGGMMDDHPASTTNKIQPIPIGFSTAPNDPFTLNAGGSREGKLMEFDTSRFVDVDGDNFPEYVDATAGQDRPMIYFSSYGGSGYQVEGIDGLIGTADDETLTIGSSLLGPRFVYYQSDTAGSGATNGFQLPWNADTYQIISPGADGKYGTGGLYDPSNGLANEGAGKDFGSLTAGPTPGEHFHNSLVPKDKELNDNGDLQRVPSLEQDNIVNFGNGRLD